MDKPDNVVRGAFGTKTDGFTKSLETPAEAHYGGGGGGDMLEARVGRLEADVSELKTDMKAVRVDIAYIKGKLDTMPTTIQLIGFIVAIFVAAGITRFIAP